MIQIYQGYSQKTLKRLETVQTEKQTEGQTGTEQRASCQEKVKNSIFPKYTYMYMYICETLDSIPFQAG